MSDNKEIFRKIYQSLPEELRQIVATQETMKINDAIAQTYSLNKEQRSRMGREITSRLIGITTVGQFSLNLEKELGINHELSIKIETDVKNKILSKVSEKTLLEQEKYAQTLLTSIPSNLPMVEEGEVAHAVPHVEQSVPPAQIPVPQNPRPEIRPEQKAPLPDYRYPGGKDPYHEPIE